MRVGKIMVRRSFMTIHVGHLVDTPEELCEEDDEVKLRSYWDYLTRNMDFKSMGYTAVALALEYGAGGRLHIQGYAEHSQKRFTTLGKNFGVQPTVFSTVIDAKGSHDYCRGLGAHADKEGVVARWSFGEFKLHGDTQKADLKMMVGLILDGAKPRELFRSHPYAWCVHRDRLLKFYEDKAIYEQKAPRKGPAVVGFSGDAEGKEGGQ